ncbi:7740_t:CDS:2 [Funneliformis mosseae]|uniref:7740_t:CDS:1 n=1 Tax=Funneliformis mosseae TaxID=27381 RepID=A0A9N9B284_FUNMO|nr:7740_t:CDS:2 [Funneliformis mosseae]
MVLMWWVMVGGEAIVCSGGSVESVGLEECYHEGIAEIAEITEIGKVSYAVFG